MTKRILLGLILTICTLINAQTPKDSITLELTELLNQSHLVGFGVAIVDADSILYANGFGYADKETGTPYTIYTEQPIASISKTILGVALMKAQEMGKLNVSDNINDYLPFHIHNPHFPKEDITIKQLANHTSSILDGDSYERCYVFKNKVPPFYMDFDDLEKKEQVRKQVEYYNENERISVEEFIEAQYVEGGTWYDPEQHFSKNLPGTAYKYSNMGANMAAYIIEQATGENYAEFVRKHILVPLQMDHTGWRGKNYEPKNPTKMYWYGLPIPNYDLITYPDGNLMTNVVDYAKFLNTMFRGYKGEDNILKAETYQQMMEDPKSDSFRKGIFWSVDSEKIGHSGNDLGVLTHAYFSREQDYGIIVFVNTSDTQNDMIEVRDIYRLLLKWAKKL